MPTPASQITGSYTSGLKYEEYPCSRLAVELDSLARRENQLVIAQEQRIKTSNVQAFWLGYGQGDGIEASELANVRGEKEAVRTAMAARYCGSKSALLSERHEHTRSPWWGMRVEDATISPKGTPDVVITRIDAGGAAEMAGLRTGDVIDTFNGIKVKNSSTLTAISRNMSIGSRVTIGIRRGSSNLSLGMTAQPKSAAL